MDASFSKELGLSSETEGQEVTLRLASRIAEIFGYEKPIAQETEFTQAADTDVSVEFDCETESNTSIPEEVRKYLAESSLYILDSNQLTREGTGEVWIRQGQPERFVFDNE